MMSILRVWIGKALLAASMGEEQNCSFTCKTSSGKVTIKDGVRGVMEGIPKGHSKCRRSRFGIYPSKGVWNSSYFPLSLKDLIPYYYRMSCCFMYCFCVCLTEKFRGHSHHVHLKCQLLYIVGVQKMLKTHIYCNLKSFNFINWKHIFY